MYSSDETKVKVEGRIKETQKVFGYVFDTYTLLNIYKLFIGKYIEKFEFPIASGKESLVFAASKGNKYFAVKIYKSVASTFKNIQRYAGQRWDIENTRDKRKFTARWAFREFRNLQLAHSSGIFAPEPMKVVGNVLVMQYLGTKRSPASLMKDCIMKEELLKLTIRAIRDLYLKAKLVHGDLSEYNFLIYRKKPFMIDIAQAVRREDPMSSVLLERDVRIMTKFFNKFDYDLDEERILSYTIGETNVFD